mmetsp:Transcript_6260/g.5013  ORF Transcript_6260/g.5013 Transcript_6260/m.5013 type:complete len:95 (+) Transcript_6260:331-615(+)
MTVFFFFFFFFHRLPLCRLLVLVLAGQPDPLSACQLPGPPARFGCVSAFFWQAPIFLALRIHLVAAGAYSATTSVLSMTLKEFCSRAQARLCHV